MGLTFTWLGVKLTLKFKPWQTNLPIEYGSDFILILKKFFLSIFLEKENFNVVWLMGKCSYVFMGFHKMSPIIILMVVSKFFG